MQKSMPQSKTHMKSNKHCKNSYYYYFGCPVWNCRTPFLSQLGSLWTSLHTHSDDDEWLAVQFKVCFFIQLWSIGRFVTGELHLDVVSKFIKALENLEEHGVKCEAKKIRGCYIEFFCWEYVWDELCHFFCTFQWHFLRH